VVGASGEVALAAEYALAFCMDLSSYWFHFGLESGVVWFVGDHFEFLQSMAAVVHLGVLISIR
jgi:hypothetical protein